MNAGIINFEVYENGTNYMGIASVNLPQVTKKTFTVNGAGVAGDVDIPVKGDRKSTRLNSSHSH